MTRQDQEQAIAKDLELCDMVSAFGDRSSKRKAKAHRKICMAQIKAWNAEGGIDLSDAELLAELQA